MARLDRLGRLRDTITRTKQRRRTRFLTYCRTRLQLLEPFQAHAPDAAGSSAQGSLRADLRRCAIAGAAVDFRLQSSAVFVVDLFVVPALLISLLGVLLIPDASVWTAAGAVTALAFALLPHVLRFAWYRRQPAATRRADIWGQRGSEFALAAQLASLVLVTLAALVAAAEAAGPWRDLLRGAVAFSVLWIVSFAAIAVVGVSVLLVRTRRLLRRFPHLWVFDDLVWLVGWLSRKPLRAFDLGQRREALARLDAAAGHMQRSMPRALPVKDAVSRSRLERHFVEAANTLRDMQSGIATPHAGTEEDLLGRLLPATYALAQGRFQDLPRQERAEVPASLRSSLQRVLRALLLAVLPLATYGALLIFGVDIPSTFATWWVAGGALWAMLNVLLWLDPLAGSKLGLLRDVYATLRTADPRSSP